MMRHLPAGWKMGRLADIGEVVTGTTPTKTRPDYYDGEVPFVTPRELDAAKPIRCAQTTLTHLGASKAKLLPAGSVLVSCIGSLGKVGFADVELATNQQINAVVPDTGRVDPRYLYQYCRTLRPVLEHVAPSTTLKIVKKSLFQELPIPLPPLPEQRRIAAILDKADAVRRKRQQTIDLADQFLRSAFLDLFGDPVTNPKGWPVIEFGELLSDISYGTSKKCTSERTVGTTPILRIPNILGGEISWDDLKHCALDARELDKLRLEDGDLLFVRTNGNPEYIARCAVFDGNDEPVAFASYLIRARFREGADALPVFLREQFSFPTYRSRLVRETRTTAGNFNISSKGLRRLRLVLPPMREQEQFFRAIEAIVRLRKKYATAQTSEEALLGSVTQRAFRGELSAPVGGKP